MLPNLAIDRGTVITWALIPFCAIIILAIFLLVPDPILAALACLTPPLLWLIISKSWARGIVVVAGGLFVLGSSSDVGAAKLIYSGALVVCVLTSLVRLVLLPPAWIRPFRTLIIPTYALICCMILGTVSSGGQDLVTVFRQGLLYLMVPIAPVVGLDVGRDLKPAVVLRWIGIIGTVAAIGFATDWLNRRGVSSLTVGKFILPSLILPSLAYGLSIVRLSFARGFRRFLWAVPLVVVPSAMLVTGTRTNLIIFLAILGVLGSSAKYRVNLGRGLLIGLFGVGSALILIPILGEFVINKPGFLDSRIQAFITVLNGDGLADGSYAGRSQQYAFATELIRENPWFGLGPGYVAPMNLDTPLATVARLGLVGTAFIALFVIAALVAVRKIGRLYGFSEVHTAVSGLTLVMLAYIPFGAPVEDRGFGFTFILVFMAVAAYAQAKTTASADGELVQRGPTEAKEKLWRPRNSEDMRRQRFLEELGSRRSRPLGRPSPLALTEEQDQDKVVR